MQVRLRHVIGGLEAQSRFTHGESVRESMHGGGCLQRCRRGACGGEARHEPDGAALKCEKFRRIDRLGMSDLVQQS